MFRSAKHYTDLATSQTQSSLASTGSFGGGGELGPGLCSRPCYSVASIWRAKYDMINVIWLYLSSNFKIESTFVRIQYFWQSKGDTKPFIISLADMIFRSNNIVECTFVMFFLYLSQRQFITSDHFHYNHISFSNAVLDQLDLVIGIRSGALTFSSLNMFWFVRLWHNPTISQSGIWIKIFLD